MRHRLELTGKLECVMPGSRATTPLVLDVSGFLELLVLRHKPYGLAPHLAKIQEGIAGSYHTISGPPNPHDERFMNYHLSLPDLSRYDSSLPPEELHFKGYKRVRQDPGLDAWRDTTALFTQIGVPEKEHGKARPLGCDLIEARAAGVIHVDLNGLAFGEVPSFEVIGGEAAAMKDACVTGTTDAARMNWAIAKFASFFFGTLQRVYSPTARSVLDAVYRPLPNNVRHERSSLRN
jgi:hypothetical protein